jgi:phage baseplate assembly protein W
MKPFLSIPLTFQTKGRSGAFERVSVEESVRQWIDLLISTKQGECFFNQDFGYEIWSYEFEPILNIHQWQPRFIEQVKDLLYKYEDRITDITVREPEIKAINRDSGEERKSYVQVHTRNKYLKDYKITLMLEYTIKLTDERHTNVNVSFEY